MTRYLLDTNHVSAVLKKQHTLVRRISDTLDAGVANLGIAIPSVGELWYMVENSIRIQENTVDLTEVLSDYSKWDFSESAAREFGVIKTELRRLGRPIPDVDVQIAAIARLNGLTLLTADAHFRSIPNMKTENWLL